MSNTFIDPKLASGVALGLIKRDILLGRTVTRDVEADFAGKKGDTVTVRRMQTVAANDFDRQTGIQVDDLDEDGVVVQLNKFPTSAVAVTDEDMTLTITDFSRQVLQPVTYALAEWVENLLIDQIQLVASSTALDQIEYDGSNATSVFNAARRQLRDAAAPQQGLTAVCGTGVYEAVLNSSRVSTVDASGASGGLRDGIAGRLSGFNVIESNLLDPDEVAFYHAQAFALALRAPVVPDSVVWGSSTSDSGYAMRLFKHYVADKKEEQVVADVLAGVATLTPAFAIRLEGAVSS